MSICDQRLNAAASLPSSVFRLNSELDVAVISDESLDVFFFFFFTLREEKQKYQL